MSRAPPNASFAELLKLSLTSMATNYTPSRTKAVLGELVTAL
jgi:hypothetical protein